MKHAEKWLHRIEIASFIQRQIKQNNTTKNQLVLTYQFQNKKNRHLQED